jgi:hypothetical protein
MQHGVVEARGRIASFPHNAQGFAACRTIRSIMKLNHTIQARLDT